MTIREVRKSIYNVSRPSHFGSIKKQMNWQQLEDDREKGEAALLGFQQYISENHPNFMPQLNELADKNALTMVNMAAVGGEEIANTWYNQSGLR